MHQLTNQLMHQLINQLTRQCLPLHHYQVVALAHIHLRGHAHFAAIRISQVERLATPENVVLYMKSQEECINRWRQCRIVLAVKVVLVAATVTFHQRGAAWPVGIQTSLVAQHAIPGNAVYRILEANHTELQLCHSDRTSSHRKAHGCAQRAAT